jgi:ADP-dependent NAD(P)H-hydrate dehydratase
MTAGDPRPLAELLAASPLPTPDGGKDGRGTAVVVGGPASCPGAAILAGTTALRAGAGKVQLVVDPAVAVATAVAFPEAFVLPWDRTSPLPPEVRTVLERADAVLVGPGLHEARAAAEAVHGAVAGQPLLLDAGALAAADAIAAVPRSPLVLAPNVDEGQRLLEGATDDEQLSLARRLAGRFGCPVAVRGEETTIDDGRSAWREAGGGPGLGTAGSGDVLVGTVVGLLARGVPATAALGWAVAAHARAGARLGSGALVGFLARELVGAIPGALAELQAELASPVRSAPASA